MRIRINDGNIYRESTYEPSDIYRRFMPCFDFLLAPENNSAEYIKNCYVPCDMDDILKDIYTSRCDGIYKLMGYTGIGKTTMICRNFGLSPSKNIPVINNSNLIIPVFFDADKPFENVKNKNDLDEKLIRKVSSVIKFIKSKFLLKLNKEDHDQKLYDFISKTKSELLEYNTEHQRFIEDDADIINSSLETLFNLNKLAYFLCDFI